MTTNISSFSPRITCVSKHATDGGNRAAAVPLGLTYISPETEPQLYHHWVNKIVPARLYAGQLSHAVAQRKLPPPQPPVESGGAPLFSFIARDTFPSRSVPLLAALGLQAVFTQELAQAAERICSTCNIKVPLVTFFQDHQIPDATIEGQGEIFLACSKDSASPLAAQELEAWAQTLGYRQKNLPPALAKIGFHTGYLLDTYQQGERGYRESTARVAPFLRRLSKDASIESVLLITTDNAPVALSALGTCAQCGATGSRIGKRVVTEVDLNNNYWSGRLLQGIPAERLLTTPLAEIDTTSAARSTLAPYLVALAGVGLVEETLLQDSSSILTSKLALARTIVSLTSLAPPRTSALIAPLPLVLHEPYDSLSSQHALTLHEVLTTTASSRSVLVLGNPPFLPSTTLAAPTLAAHNTPLVIAEPPPRGSDTTLGEWLGLTPLLVRRYAMSISAKVAGITERDFKRRQARKPNRYTCERCAGLGFVVRTVQVEETYDLIHRSHTFIEKRCSRCNGAAYISPIREITFKEKTLTELLQQSIFSILDNLKSLPRVSDGLLALERLSLLELPLILPLEFLTPSERTRLAIVKAFFNAPRPEFRKERDGESPVRAIITAQVDTGPLTRKDLLAMEQLTQAALTTGIHLRICHGESVKKEISR